MKIRAVIFDLDGTLVDSGLDFDLIRRDLGLDPRSEILEEISKLPSSMAIAHAEAILLQHEIAGAIRAIPMPGAQQLLIDLKNAHIKCGIFTRNCRIAAELTIRRLGMTIDFLVSRDDAPAKPNADGLKLMLKHWDLCPDEALYVGDYCYDVEAGQRAGIRTVLYAPQPPGFEHSATFKIESLERVKFLAR